MLKQYKIIIAYDGTDFHGWQAQPFDITISSVLQKTFESAFSKKISLSPLVERSSTLIRMIFVMHGIMHFQIQLLFGLSN
jgi:tRNA U38,U39,U40 pseudouridine synthase TruA